MKKEEIYDGNVWGCDFEDRLRDEEGEEGWVREGGMWSGIDGLGEGWGEILVVKKGEGMK